MCNMSVLLSKYIIVIGVFIYCIPLIGQSISGNYSQNRFYIMLHKVLQCILLTIAQYKPYND